MPGSNCNRTHYEEVWAKARVWAPSAWSEWPIISELIPANGRILEIGAGKRPRVPISRSYFVDLSAEAGRALVQLGGHSVVGDACLLPFCDSCFELLVCAELVEHIADDASALHEWSRVTKPGGCLILTTPLYKHLWTDFDRIAGHVRRYEPADLHAKLEDAGFQVQRYVVNRISGYRRTKEWQAKMFGIAPRFALWLEDRIVMPLAISLSRKVREFEWRTRLDQEKDVEAVSVLVICSRV